MVNSEYYTMPQKHKNTWYTVVTCIVITFYMLTLLLHVAPRLIIGAVYRQLKEKMTVCEISMCTIVRV